MGLFNNLKKRLKDKPTVDVQKEVIRGLTTAKLYTLLNDAGVTKADLASKLNVSKATVTGWLSGNRNFTIDTLTHIAYVFDKTPKIDFVPLDARHEATLVSLPTAANSVEVRSKDESVVQTSHYTIKFASNDK